MGMPIVLVMLVVLEGGGCCLEWALSSYATANVRDCVRPGRWLRNSQGLSSRNKQLIAEGEDRFRSPTR